MLQISARVKHDIDEEDESEEDDEYDEEVSSETRQITLGPNFLKMADFIDDGEVEEDDQSFREERRRKRKKRPTKYRIDEEDREIIKENVGIEIAEKKRLKRTAEIVAHDTASHEDKALVKKEIEVKERQQPVTTKIDTTRQRRPDYKAEMQRDYYEEMISSRQIDNTDKLRQA